MDYGTFYFILEEWGTGKSLPDGDFRNLLEALRPIVPESITQDSYEGIYEGLVRLFNNIMFQGTEQTLWTITPNFFEAEFSCTENEQGINLDEEYEEDPIPVIALARDQQGIPTQSDTLAVITEAIAQLNPERYQRGGIPQLLIDWHWWGQQVWWENPDTIGGGDEIFQVHRAVNRNNYLFTFIPPNPNIPTIPNYRPIITSQEATQETLMNIK